MYLILLAIELAGKKEEKQIIKETRLCSSCPSGAAKLSANRLLAIPQATFIRPLHSTLLEKQHSYPTTAENNLLKDLLFKYLFTML